LRFGSWFDRELDGSRGAVREPSSPEQDPSSPEADHPRPAAPGVDAEGGAAGVSALPDIYDYGRGKAAELRCAVHAVLLQHEAAGELPTSNRFVFYELRGSGPLYGHATRRQGRAHDQNLSDASKWLRDEGFVPWEWIVDETRSLTEYEYADTVADFLADSIDAARITPWDDEPPLIVCESRTFGGVLARTIAAEYLCPVTATNGQVGGFLHTNVVPILFGNDRPVLYVGDYDLAGADIEENTRRVLVHEAGEREWTRVALTADQAKALPTVDKIDRRFKPPQIHKAVEVEALGQGTVTRIIRAALDALLPEPLADVVRREEEQKERAREWIRREGGVA
jgi:hypothetical protein